MCHSISYHQRRKEVELRQQQRLNPSKSLLHPAPKKKKMGDRPKRNRRAPERYEPDEVPVDDYDDETGETAEEQVYKKRWRGEFDELDDEDEEEMDEPDEYDVNDGFAVPDDFEESVEDDDEDDEEEDFDEEEEDDSFENSFEPDVAEPEEPEESY